jgi:hypothetical protein
MVDILEHRADSSVDASADIPCDAVAAALAEVRHCCCSLRGNVPWVEEDTANDGVEEDGVPFHMNVPVAWASFGTCAEVVVDNSGHTEVVVAAVSMLRWTTQKRFEEPRTVPPPPLLLLMVLAVVLWMDYYYY